MKINSLKSSLLLLPLVALCGVGCLKDKDYNDGLTQSNRNTGTNQNVIEIQLTATNTDNFLLTSLNASSTDTTINLIPVVLASPNVASEDINVTLVPNPTIVADYNAANGTSYVAPPTNIYTILNAGNVVTIPKGSRVGYLQIRFKPINFLGADYAFGFSIGSIDKQNYMISGNLKNGIAAIGIKNKYDGNYAMRIKTVGWGAYGIADGVSGTWPSQIGLVTVSATSNSIIDYARGDNLQPAFTGGVGVLGGATAFGATTPLYVFDPVTNALTDVRNTTPDDGRGRVLHLNPAVTTSRYDPNTKTIYAAYIMQQNGRPDQFIYDTLVYVGSR